MDYKCQVDENNKATELPLLRLGGTAQQNPHMRAFWASTISFFLAFLGNQFPQQYHVVWFDLVYESHEQIP